MSKQIENPTTLRVIEAKIEVIQTCRECGDCITMEVNKSDLDRWISGNALVQDAFPYLTADQREILISGICGKCFDKMFPADIIEE